jgi:hypothetical protein
MKSYEVWLLFSIVFLILSLFSQSNSWANYLLFMGILSIIMYWNKKDFEP